MGTLSGRPGCRFRHLPLQHSQREGQGVLTAERVGRHRDERMLLSAIAPRADAIALPTDAVALDRRPVTARVREWVVPDPRNILSDRAVRVGGCPTSQILEGHMMFSRVAFWVSLPTVTLWRRQLFATRLFATKYPARTVQTPVRIPTRGG